MTANARWWLKASRARPLRTAGAVAVSPVVVGVVAVRVSV